MAAAARAHATEWGKALAGRALIAYGGAAPLHATQLADKLGIDLIVVPTGAGVGSALGFLAAPVAYEVVRSRYMRVATFDAGAIAAVMAEMREEAHAVVAFAADAPFTETRRAYMRYVGQGFEIAVALEDGAEASGATLATAFEDAYRALYGRTIAGLDIEALSWTLTLSAPAPPLPAAAATAPPATPLEAAPLFDPTRQTVVPAARQAREALAPGQTLNGPALIVEAQTTTVVGAGFRAVKSTDGDLVLRRVSVAKGQA